MRTEILIYILIMALITYLIRMLPLVVFRKEIKSRFIKSFLYYVPYVTLSVMTFPAILYATGSAVCGALALVAGIAAAWFGLGLFPVSAICCVVVYVAQLFI